MDNELLQSIAVRPSCDCCHIPTDALFEIEDFREVAGGGVLVQIRFCLSCLPMDAKH